MQQTISQAAQLYGKARSTIHRAIDAGRLSCSVRGDGVRVIDLAELIRLWGEPPNSPPQTQQNATPSEEPAQQVQQAMLDELRALRAEVAALRQEMRARPAPEVDKVHTVDSAPEPPQEPRKADTPADDTRNELRSLVAALRDSEG
ncbi:hypothetical protein GCM10009578_100140 [Streptomyces rhizosphaericus]|uniref:hypothetical protein n=1 Tax=Streptomyces rhizosphaericus TaxID=114699 RepID=UPI0031D4AA58